MTYHSLRLKLAFMTDNSYNMVLQGISWKEIRMLFQQIPPKFSSYFGNFVGMTHFYGVRRQMRRTSTPLSDQAAFALNT